MEFDKPEVTIGRVQGNDIILPKGNISKRHSRIVLKDGKFIIVDLKSTNGTYVNGRKITSPHILKDADKIYIGDFTLTVEPEGAQAEAPPPPPPPPAPSPAPSPPAPRQSKPAPQRRPPPEPPPPEEEDFEEFIAPEEDYSSGGGDEFEEFAPEPDFEPAEAAPPPPPPPAPPRVAVKKGGKRPSAGAAPAARRPSSPARRRPESSGLPAAQAAVFEALSQKADLDQLADDPAAAEQTARRAFDEVSAAGGIPNGVDADAVVTRIVTELLGLGPLDALLNDETVSQIFANSPHNIFIEQDGEIQQHDTTFSNADSMSYVVHKLLGPFDGTAPIIDTRLSDGTHVSALLPPVGARGPVLTLRKPVQPTATLEELVADGSLTEGMADFLRTCVTYRKNVVISANSAADGTSLLRALASAIDEDERIVTVEEVSQLNLSQANVVSLEAAPMAGERGVGLRDLVRLALRLSPERLVVGDCRGGEALEILQAMGGALDGSLLQVHGHSARDCIGRVEAMMLMGGIDATARALREAIVNAVEVIVQVSRFADGIPRVTQIAAVSGMEVDLITMQDIFTFRAEGTDKEGNTLGRFSASGVVPHFYEELQKRGERVNLGIFREGE